MKINPDPGFPVASCTPYLDVFAKLHRTLKPNWYLEIGTQTGASLALSKARSISVDPLYHLRNEVMGEKPELLMVQETSDAFFESGLLEARDIKIDLAFLDGMHLFEFLLRDFINTEAHMTPRGLVVLHDCLPWTANMTSRDRANCKTNAWTGDVWKIVPTLQKYRPDLDIEVLDAAPTGLVMVGGLDPQNRTLKENYDAILGALQETELTDFGSKRYFDALAISPAHDSRWTSVNSPYLARGWKDNPSIAIKIAAGGAEKMETWGDYRFARSLANAFGRQGHRATIHAQDTWYDDTTPGGIDLVLRGKANVRRMPNRPCLIWSISKAARPMNFAQADHVFFASKKLLDRARDFPDARAVSLLLQAFDTDQMQPRQNIAGHGLVFVGRSRNFERPSVVGAARSGEPFALYGPGWQNTKFATFHQVQRVSEDDLSEIYSNAEIVLNDSTPVMKEAGFLSNRVFDTLATGAIPVTDDVGWMPEDLAPYVYTYDAPAGFEAAISAAQNETVLKRKERLAFAHEIRNSHSFDARAAEILAKVDELRDSLRIAAE